MFSLLFFFCWVHTINIKLVIFHLLPIRHTHMCKQFWDDRNQQQTIIIYVNSMQWKRQYVQAVKIIWIFDFLLCIQRFKAITPTWFVESFKAIFLAYAMDLECSNVFVNSFANIKRKRKMVLNKRNIIELIKIMNFTTDYWVPTTKKSIEKRMNEKMSAKRAVSSMNTNTSTKHYCIFEQMYEMYVNVHDSGNHFHE